MFLRLKFSFNIIDTTTGISASDRALTIRSLATPTHSPNDFKRPGHVFPLRSVPGGVLERQGHTEAAIDLCILSGLIPVAAIAEIVLDDVNPTSGNLFIGKGNMARQDDLKKLAKLWGFKMISIRDLIQYRLDHNV